MRFYRRFFFNCCTWQDGAARDISFDALMPIPLVPILMVIASQSLTCTVFIFFATPLFVHLIDRNFLQFLIHTKFFFMWTVTSVVMLLLVFELAVVPLLEISPKENLFFMICVFGGLFSGYKTKENAYKSIQENFTLHGIDIRKNNQDICNICKKYTYKKAFHCRLCQNCIVGRIYHCKWLDCCIGVNNLRCYVTCLFFSTLAFLYGSNLIMTTVCYPYKFTDLLLLPYDCTDVYYEFDVAISFVSSIYSLFLGLVGFLYLLYNFWLLCFARTSKKSVLSNKNKLSEEAQRN